MKTLALLLLSLTVALGVPAPPPGVPQNPVLAEGDLHPLLADVLPVQGHVVVKDPAPQVRLGSQEEKEKLAPAPVDVQQGQQVVGLAVKVKPEAVAERKDGVWTEVKVEPEVREVKAEPQVKAEAEVKVEPEVREVKAEPQVKAEAEVKVEPEVREVKAEPQVKAEAEVKVEPEVNAEAGAKVEPEVNVEEEENPDFKLESEEKVEPEVMARLELNENPEAEIEPDVQGEPEPEYQPMFNEEQGAQEEYQVQMNLEDEPDTEFERHIDTEGRYGMMPEPIMELEPEDDDNMFGEELGDTELSEVEISPRGAFQNEEGRAEERFLGAEPIMELEPLDEDMFGEEPSNIELDQAERSLRGAFKNEEPVIQMSPEEEGLAEERFLGAEPIVELEPLDEDMFGEEPGNAELAEAEKSLKEAFRSEDPAVQSLPEEEEGLEADAEFERHIDMEGKNEMVGETTTELEDDSNVFGDELSNGELSETEKSLREAFENKGPVNEPQPK
ncbi:uncharacterized protein AB9X84_014010 [Acanthopagrus schlegelii]